MKLSWVLISIVFLLNIALAFNVDVHVYLAKGMLLKYYPHCERDIEIGAAYAHNVLNETENDHCYTTTRCPAFDANYCPTLLTCPAVQIQEQWMGVAKEKEDCEQAKYVAIATHYFIEPRDIMKQMINVDYECIVDYEAKISQAVARDPNNFEISQRCTSPDKEFTFTSKNLKDLAIDLDTGVITSNFPLKSYPPNETKPNITNGTTGKPGLQPRIDRITEQISLKSGSKESVQLAVTNIGLDDGQFLLQVSCPANIEATYDPILLINSGETKSASITLKGSTITSGECTVTVLDEKNTTSKDSKTFSYSIVKNCPQQCTGFSTQGSDPNTCSCVCDVSKLNAKCQIDNLTSNATSCTCEEPQTVEPAKCLGLFLILFGLYAGMRITKL